MVSPLSEFCKERGIPNEIKNSFGVYVRSVYARKFLMAENGETIHMMVNQLSQEILAELWNDFVVELAKYLPAQNPK
jgi:hypothetical protein